MKTIIIKTIGCSILILLVSCSNIRPGQMSTVKDSALNGTGTDQLGGSATTSVEGAPSYSMTGGGGL